ncbi:MAG: DMT family protein [Myxococcota bacterium]
MSEAWPILRTIGLLIASNLFMTAAWYGHLRYKSSPLWLAIGVSWLIALPEYAIQVPANRWGFDLLSAYQLKIIQECVTLLVFVGFAWLALKEPPRWNHVVAFGLVLAAVAVAFYRPK